MGHGHREELVYDQAGTCTCTCSCTRTCTVTGKRTSGRR